MSIGRAETLPQLLRLQAGRFGDKLAYVQDLVQYVILVQSAPMLARLDEASLR